jgi:hypothetical protein
MNPTPRNFFVGSTVAALISMSGKKLGIAHAQDRPAPLPAIAALKDRRQEATPITGTEREARVARARFDEPHRSGRNLYGGWNLAALFYRRLLLLERADDGAGSARQGSAVCGLPGI